MTRPKYAPRRDKNDNIVTIAVKELNNPNVKIVDVSKVGGLIDRLVWIYSLEIGFEVKVHDALYKKGGEVRETTSGCLTKGEKEFPGIVCIVSSSDQVKEVIQALLPFAEELSSILNSQIGVLKKYGRK